ncbi:hypothetical protein F4779DRAFT_368463 [Xylariaceae sp. FL0662B]|nr:hypothetical protein F4779DRAFT_368463 [Xylariaceae sp. FL0662B]
MTQKDGSETPSSSTIKQYGDWQERNELTHFLRNYSADPLDPLYVGSSLAAQLGQNLSDSWVSGFSQDSTQQDQASPAGTQTGPVSGLARSSIPQSEKRGSHPDNTNLVLGSNPNVRVDHEETAQAALLLQALGQDPPGRLRYTWETRAPIANNKNGTKVTKNRDKPRSTFKGKRNDTVEFTARHHSR